MEWLILVVVLVAVVAVAAVLIPRSRSAALRRRFGPEYDRAVAQEGDRRKAEATLRELARRRAAIDVQPLSDGSRDRYRARWRETQARFVDAPRQAVAGADTLVSEVMQERGYPVGGVDEQAALVAVDLSGELADEYRRAHDAHQRDTSGPGATENLRVAFLGYRAVFQALASAGSTDTEPPGAPAAADTAAGTADPGAGVGGSGTDMTGPTGAGRSGAPAGTDPDRQPAPAGRKDGAGADGQASDAGGQRASRKGSDRPGAGPTPLPVTGRRP